MREVGWIDTVRRMAHAFEPEIPAEVVDHLRFHVSYLGALVSELTIDTLEQV